MKKYDSRIDTRKHIKRVNELIDIFCRKLKTKVKNPKIVIREKSRLGVI
jgi:hypothetical protein